MITEYPLVSVIMTTYNSTFFLEEAISSVVIKQTYPNIELIIVDDCSTNGTRDQLLELQKKYPFRLILLDKNSGSASRPTNIGIQSARGHYITVCAQDDYYLANKISLQVEFLEKNQHYMASYSRSYVLYQSQNKVKKMKKLNCKSGYIFADIFLQKFYIPALTMMVRKDTFNQIGYFDETLLIEDWDMWLRIANHSQIGFINQYLTCYRIHQHNSSLVYSKRMIKDREIIINKWQHAPEHSKAVAIYRLLEGISIKKSFFLLLKDTSTALFALKQPYRVLRLFLSNIKRQLRH